MSILNHPRISDAYFFPQPNTCEEAIAVDIGDATLRCFHYRPHPELPTLVHFHGNGESVAGYVQRSFPSFISAELCGINVLMIEYRGYGGSSGSAELVTMLSDGAQVLKQLDISPNKVVVYGRSIGSLYAIELASRCCDLAGLVIDSGIANIRERFLDNLNLQRAVEGLNVEELEAEIAVHFDHRQKLSRYRGPLLLFHTENDGIIGLNHAERLFEWGVNASKELRVYYAGNHNTIFRENYHDILFSLRQFCQRAFPNAPWLPYSGERTLSASPAYVRVQSMVQKN